MDGCFPLHCIVPPYMLEAIEVRGTAEQREAAAQIAERPPPTGLSGSPIRPRRDSWSPPS